MKAKFLKLRDDVVNSYWFIPTIMAGLSLILAIVLTAYNEYLPSKWMSTFSWLHLNRDDGARAVLSTIAGSMIGVAGVTFSITIAAISYASGQFGPRILNNFMGDRANQVTLGTFTSSFVYCLMVMRTINSTEDNTFVPHIAILVAMLFALAGIGVLIFYIHHISESIHISHVVAEIGVELDRSLKRQAAALGVLEHDLSPDGIEPPEISGEFFDAARAVPATSNGYVRTVDISGLLSIAKEHDLIMVLLHQPGTFVVRGDPLVMAQPSERVNELIEGRIAQCYSTGHERSASQDPMFLVDELVEIAARALSPGINDPFTAMNCLDWLSTAVLQSANVRTNVMHRFDEDRQLRLVVTRCSTPHIIEAIFERLRPYFCADRNAALHMFGVMTTIVSHLNESHQETLGLMTEKAKLFHTSCMRVQPPEERPPLEQAFRQFNMALRSEDQLRRLELKNMLAAPKATAKTYMH